MDQPQETLIFPHWAGRTKWFMVVMLVMCTILLLLNIAQLALGPTKHKFDMTPFTIFEAAMWGALILGNIYVISLEMRRHTELTEESLRVIDEKGKVSAEMALVDVVELRYFKGLFAEQRWTLKSRDGHIMSFDEKLGRNIELAAALESRTGLTFIRVDGQGKAIEVGT